MIVKPIQHKNIAKGVALAWRVELTFFKFDREKNGRENKMEIFSLWAECCSSSLRTSKYNISCLDTKRSSLKSKNWAH